MRKDFVGIEGMASVVGSDFVALTNPVGAGDY